MKRLPLKDAVHALEPSELRPIVVNPIKSFNKTSQVKQSGSRGMASLNRLGSVSVDVNS